ncbi:MAG: hypothetical protein IJ728_14295 [Selenomonadaceae bacterium]|nr:hypothetical protein [Selenomonadaceae bacterium]MBR1730682.1 hypothetical protein [Selenomonadaceae bacterium]
MTIDEMVDEAIREFEDESLVEIKGDEIKINHVGKVIFRFADDGESWDSLLYYTNIHYPKLSKLLLSARALKAKLKPSDKYGYIIVTSEMNDNEKSLYERKIRPQIKEYEEYLLAMLKNTRHIDKISERWQNDRH